MPTHTQSTRAPAPSSTGGARKGKLTLTFAALADSDSEEQTPSVFPMELDGLWGDIVCAAHPPVAAKKSTWVRPLPLLPQKTLVWPIDSVTLERLEREAEAAKKMRDYYERRRVADAAAAAAAEAEAAAAATCTTEDDLFAEPFASELVEQMPSIFTTANMTEVDYMALMTWLYAKGWSIQHECRQWVQIYPDDLPPRVWVQPSKPRAKTSAVMRFCRASGECGDAGCRYVHGDTIPRLNEPCSFGASCGAGDPAKRAMCLRMHPHEVYHSGMVVHRNPAPAPAS